MAETTGLVLGGLSAGWGSGLGQGLCLQRSEEGPSFLIHQGSFSLVVKAGWQQQEKADQGAEIQGDVGERKEMGSRFLSPTLRACVYLKKTNTSFNWVVLVFKITQGGGGGGCVHTGQDPLLALLLRPSGVARATGRGRDPSGVTPVPVGTSGRPRQATPYTGERGWETWRTSSSHSLENSFCLEKRFCLTPFLASEALKGDRNRGPPRGFNRPLRRLPGPGLCLLGCGCGRGVRTTWAQEQHPGLAQHWGRQTRFLL